MVSEWEKMSKSKHNGVDPAAMIEKYGSDTVGSCRNRSSSRIRSLLQVRLMMLSSVGPSSERKWSEAESYPGVRNMTIKLWKLVFQVRLLLTC